jgi:Ca-activated chloride channel family protein
MTDLAAILKTFRFVSWWFLGLLLLIPIWSWLRGRFSPVAAVEFSSGDLLRAVSQKPRFHRRQWLLAMRYFALLLLILALARPQVEKGLSDVDAKGINIMLVLDWSGTMKKRDFIMDNKRVTRAQALVKVIIEFMRSRPHDRIGLVRFDADAFLISPLTLDHDWLIARLKEEKSGRGTAPGSGMLIAAEHLLPATNQTKVIIIVTDAEQVNHGPPPGDVGKALLPLGIRAHLIQIVDFKDMAGNLNGNEMAQIPKLTGGQLFQVADFGGLRSVYRQIDLLEKANFKEDKQRDYRELMIWFAVPALALLLLELLLRQTVWRRLP